MKGYSVRLKYGISMKDFFFQSDAVNSDQMWNEAMDSLYKTMDACKDSKEFFERVPVFFKECGFEMIQK